MPILYPTEVLSMCQLNNLIIQQGLAGLDYRIDILGRDFGGNWVWHYSIIKTKIQALQHIGFSGCQIVCGEATGHRLGGFQDECGKGVDVDGAILTAHGHGLHEKARGRVGDAVRTAGGGDDQRELGAGRDADAVIGSIIASHRGDDRAGEIGYRYRG